ncbi:efflux transporter outer membrane subunit [Croceicoccus mobilis]|uniref:Membrane protein n=1 Tax=Croceicoccus mobilis TaxID=1703339 RepID=A0A916ZAF9_9SPHN|nr:efflux transporter outer membrane subunit [Croceicoccus mobilis]GGD82574.1 membrane protein [Croceicoccus mobilis]
MRIFAPLTCLAALAACTVGPDYDGPPKVAGGAVERGSFVRGGDIADAGRPELMEWWSALGDPVLNGLIDDALANSPDIAAAEAKIAQARAKIGGARAALFPSLSASALYAHAELPGSGIGQSSEADGSSAGTSTLNFYNVGANASWNPDLFGGSRRKLEAARADYQKSGFDLADAQVQLTAQVAQNYVNLRDAQARDALNARSIDLMRKSLVLTQARYDAGTATRLEVDRMEGDLRTMIAQAAPLEAQIAAYLDALAVLTGRVPGELDAVLEQPSPVPLPPANVSVGDPAALIARRPDIRAAERALASANANIGVNKASLFPQISFTGILGLGGTDPGDVLDPGNLSTIALPMLSWSILDFGAGQARVRGAEAQADQARAQYRGTVLEALQKAEDSLARFGATRKQLAAFLLAERAAQDAGTLNAARYKAGTATLIDQYGAERQAIAAAISTEKARTQLAVDYISVMMELGLGWDGEDPGES